jgi:NAD(P)-dependent dehydrogenase (short-subunit alcohol dehydrogenase family)
MTTHETKPSTLAGKRIVVIGGSSGMGLATAQAAAEAGAKVIIASRSAEKLDEARKQIPGRVAVLPLDVTDAAAVQEAFGQLGPIDHLVVSGSATSAGEFRSQPLRDARATFESKFWGAYSAVRSAQFNAGGSVVLFSGVFSRRPAPGYVAMAAVNGAIESLGRALAVELAPLRVNVVSPGMTDTPAYAGMPQAQREGMFAAVAAHLPARRIGRPADLAAAVLHLLGNGYVTGTVLDVDGGALLV